MKKFNGVSIVIPTHGGHLKFLKNLLLSIKQAGNKPKNRSYGYKIIVINNLLVWREHLCRSFIKSFVKIR